jgi:hypothetical protein
MTAASMSIQMGFAYAKDVTRIGIVDLGDPRPC